MSEHAPDRPEQRKEPTFTINFDGVEYKLSPQNTTIFIHSGDDQAYDHIYQVTNNDPDSDPEGVVFFREHLENFQAFTESMLKHGFAPIHRAVCSDSDKEIYRQVFGRLAPHDEEKVVDVENLVPSYVLTPRHEELIKKFGETVVAMPDDLLYDEVTTDHDRPYPERWN